MTLRDAYNRPIRDLRISLTDRCNFRCFYCLPNGEPPLARKATILTFEEIVYLSEIFVSLGIEKIRLTGGEPMLRRNIELLVVKLSKLKPQLKDLALTTNGFDIPKKAQVLKEAGLDRMTISLDTLQTLRFPSFARHVLGKLDEHGSTRASAARHGAELRAAADGAPACTARLVSVGSLCLSIPRPACARATDHCPGDCRSFFASMAVCDARRPHLPRAPLKAGRECPAARGFPSGFSTRARERPPTRVRAGFARFA